MRSWSVSSVRSFLSCSLAWWFRRTGAPPETRPLALVEGSVLHEVLAEDLKHRMTGATLEPEDGLDLLDAAWFTEEASGQIHYGAKHDRETVLARLRRLYLHWRESWQLEGDIVAVEEELRVQLLGIDLPLLGYVDLVVETEAGDQVIDWKVTASRPRADDLLDALDLQKLAMARAWETGRSRLVARWSWGHLVKTAEPRFEENVVDVSPTERDSDLERLVAVVQPTIDAMRAVLIGERAPVPQPGFLCGGCSYRRACAGWRG